jgi:hypothetical protein
LAICLTNGTQSLLSTPVGSGYKVLRRFIAPTFDSGLPLVKTTVKNKPIIERRLILDKAQYSEEESIFRFPDFEFSEAQGRFRVPMPLQWFILASALMPYGYLNGFRFEHLVRRLIESPLQK